MSISIGGDSQFGGMQLHAAVIDEAPEGRVHTLAFSVEAKVGSDRQHQRTRDRPFGPGQWRQTTPANLSGGRALIFALPADPDSIRFIDTGVFPRFVEDQVKALNHVPSSLAVGIPAPSSFGLADQVRLVEAGDITVVIARSAKEIEAVLRSEAVPAHKRPTVSPDFCAEMEHLYGGESRWPFVIGCFDASVKPRVTLFLRYKSRAPDYLYYPGLTGTELPIVGAPVETDHFLTASVPKMVSGTAVSYSEAAAVARCRFIPRSIRGLPCFGRQPNGDFAIRVSDLASPAPFELLRMSPPGSETRLRAVATKEDRWGF